VTALQLICVVVNEKNKLKIIYKNPIEIDFFLYIANFCQT
jgi:hypothetical protein